MFSRLGSVGALVLLVSCGGSKQPEAKAPDVVSATPDVTTVEEAPDLSPVTRPEQVVLVARVARPRQFVETLTKWSNVPLRLEDMMPEHVRGVASAVLWEAPIESVLMLDPLGDGKFPPPLFAASIGLKSLEAGLSAAESMQLQTRRLAPGVYRVGDFGGTSCAMAASLGTAPARLVCGDGPKDIDGLLPYLTRGLPTEPQGANDFELIATAKPLQDRYSHDVNGLRLLAGVAMRTAALDSPRFDRALSDLIYGTVDETINLFNDLDQIKLEARIDATRNVLVGSGELKLKGDASWIAGTMAASKSAPLPAGLPRIPPGATTAVYATPSAAERYAAMSRILGDLLEGFLEHEKVPDATRQRARHLLDGMFAKAPEMFSFTMSPPQRDGTAYLHGDTTITRLSEPSGRVVGIYSDIFALLNEPALKKWAKDKFKVEAKAWPKVVKKPFKLAGFKAPATMWEITIDGKALASADPKLAKALENTIISVDPNLPTKLLLVVQPDGDVTYTLTGDDPKEMARVMAEHKKVEPGLALAKPARAEKVSLAGFVTLAYLARQVERAAKKPEIGKAVAATPHHGETPLPFSMTASAGSVRFDVELPADVLSDTTSAAAQSAGAFKDAFDK